MEITFNGLQRLYDRYQNEYEDTALRVMRSGRYILGNELTAFEKEFADYLGVKHCAGVANGLDALRIAFHLLDCGPGDEVIIQSNAYIACVMGITMNGATPVFVEPDEYHNLNADKIEEKITPKTKAVLAVHLYGQASDMRKIKAICEKHRIYLVEDCAQSHGAEFDGQMTGSFGDISCFSFYPSKNLGALGDAGAVVTDNNVLDAACRTFRNYGSSKRYYFDVVGLNSRLDEIQAGFLRVRLNHLDELNGEHCRICEKYMREMKNPLIETPKVRPGATSVWHQFVVKTPYRDKLAAYLKENGIDTIVHYPIPPHLSQAYAYLGYKRGDLPVAEKLADEVLSLPQFNGMTEDEMDYLTEKINAFRV